MIKNLFHASNLSMKLRKGTSGRFGRGLEQHLRSLSEASFMRFLLTFRAGVALIQLCVFVIVILNDAAGDDPHLLILIA